MIKKIIVIFILLILSIIMSICIGSVFISPKEVVSIILYKLFNFGFVENMNKINIVFNIRLPHIILSLFVGASLSMTGILMQSILKNSLASVYNLGISSGAGFGVSLIIISGIYFNYYFFIISSVLFGFITILFILFISKRIDKNMNSNSIILAGVVISLFFSSIMSFFAYTFPKYSNQIIFWQLGNLFVRNYFDIFVIILLTIIFLIVLTKNANILDIMTFGDKESLLLGINAKKYRILFILLSSLVTGVLVAFVGVIGFIDLISPHIARRLFGAKHIIVIPMSALIGALILNIADIFSRVIVSGSNIPIGIVTAIIGAPFFLYVFIKN